MIDTGEESLSDDILKYFNENNITRLEYLIITHFDKDHVGSAASIIDNIDIGEVLQSNSPKESEYYTNYLTSLANKNINPTTVSGNYELSFEDLTIVVNGPVTIYEKNESNNSSLIVSVTASPTEDAPVITTLSPFLTIPVSNALSIAYWNNSSVLFFFSAYTG